METVRMDVPLDQIKKVLRQLPPLLCVLKSFLRRETPSRVYWIRLSRMPISL
jgi:hypothetical protein